MAPSKSPTRGDTQGPTDPTPFMGSEYMDAPTYLAKPSRVTASDTGSHGSNDFDYGVVPDAGT